MKITRFCLGGLYFLIVLGCSKVNEENTPQGPLFQLHTSESTGIDFSNTLYPSNTLNVISFEYFYNGAGVAVGDLNNDGLPDIYFSGNMVPGKLYLNKGNFKFEDITAQSGINTKGKWGTGVSMVDINADGLLDLYLCFSGPYGPEQRKNMLYINKGNLVFSEEAAAYGLDDDAHTTQTVFFDYDRDGDLDAYMLNNMTDQTGPNVIRPKRNQGQMVNTDKLFRNDKGFFTDVSATAGVLKEGYGLGVAIGDIDQDTWPDIYVSNDYLSNDLLYRNNGDGTFTDVAEKFLKHSSYSSMGCDLADYNNDGLLDLVAVDMLPPDQKRRAEMMASINPKRFQSELDHGYFPQFMRNTLQLHQGYKDKEIIPFSEVGFLAGIESTDWSWSPLFVDIDNNGLKDLLITNGYPRDITNMDFASYKANQILGGSSFNNAVLADLAKELEHIEGAYLPNFAFKNQGDLTFKDESKGVGFLQNSFSHGAAVADLDNDGDLDYIVNNSYDHAFIYENTLQRQPANNFLRIVLKQKSQNIEGWGSKVTLFQEGKQQYQEHYSIRGYQSAIEPIMHFGLGGKNADSLQVQWPDGRLQMIRQVSADQTMVVRYNPDPDPPIKPVLKQQSTVFNAVEVVQHAHVEPGFSDFGKLPLLAQGHAQEGPELCVGDVDQNGLDDFFIGGAKGSPGMIYTQKKDGHFVGQPLPTGADSEDLGAVFFDADGDGDLDLYVTSGSTEYEPTAVLYQDRLYLNDGKGNFTDHTGLLPVMPYNTTTVAAGDFDQDGDMDLFVGGGADPVHYGPSKSFLLENQSGRFVDITEKAAPELRQIGVITDAHWEDMDADRYPELWISGEWLPITLFKNKKGQLFNVTAEVGLANTVGWWNTLALSDLDKDGDLDVVVGNLGLNTPYRSSTEHPFSQHLVDYRQNGTTDLILSHYLQGTQAPLHFRNDLLDRLPVLKTKFRDYHSYAIAKWEDVIPTATIRSTIKINTFETSWLENDNGHYKVHPLPKLAQLAPVYGIFLSDFNRDGFTDILLSGNSTDQNPFVGYLDAFNGLLLLGGSNHIFVPQAAQQSGFYVNKNGRAIASLHSALGYSLLLTAQNNGPLLGFSYDNKNREND